MTRRQPETPTPADWQGREPVFATFQPLVNGLTRLLFRLEVTGPGAVPADGPAVVVANHVSHLDPLVLFSLLTAAGRRPRFLALADHWATPGLGWLLEKGHMIPVHRGAGREASERMVAVACSALDAGQIVAVYPEGQLPRPEQPQRPQEGAGRLMLATDAPVIPVIMRGVPPWTGRIPTPRRPVQVAVRRPLDLNDLRGSELTSSAAREAAQRALDAFEDPGV